MGKTKDILEKIGITKGTFHGRMDIIKDMNCKELTESEDTEKRWQ